MKISITSERPPTRCEICHQSDEFNSILNHCHRCNGVIDPFVEQKQTANKLRNYIATQPGITKEYRFPRLRRFLCQIGIHDCDIRGFICTYPPNCPQEMCCRSIRVKCNNCGYYTVRTVNNADHSAQYGSYAFHIYQQELKPYDRDQVLLKLMNFE